jgi:ABC-2 type transport system ATP-binding protein
MSYAESRRLSMGRVVRVRSFSESREDESPALLAEGLGKRFDGHSAADGISLSIRRGETLGLLGPNGAGKTTTLRMLAGILRPDAGRVRVSGLDPRMPDGRMGVGFAPQELALYPELTVEENLAFFGRLHRLRGRALAARVVAALDLAGLGDRRRRRVASLSGGMQRRLNLACAVVHEPAVLLLDEPTAGVDAQSRDHIVRSLSAIRDGGTSILYSTHYLEEAERLCDRVVIVDRGRVVAEGTVLELIHGVRAGERDGDVYEATSAIRYPRRAERVVAPSALESVFLSVTGRALRDA